MFVMFNQARADLPLALDVKNIKTFYPEEISLDSSDKTVTCTAIELYDGSAWLVKQRVFEVYEACQKAKRGEL